MKKILIVYATAGIGHKKASLAIKKAFDEIKPSNTEVILIDSLDYTSDFYKWSYLNSYLLMVNKLSLFWGFLYYLTDNYYVNLVISKIRRLSNWMNGKKLEDYIVKLRPDVILSTHFFASEVISDMKRKGLIKSKLITVITDYRHHSWWVTGCVDTCVVGGEDAGTDLLKAGITQPKIEVLGIPVEPIFSKKLDRKEMLEKHHLKENVFTALVIGGGFGVGPIEDIVKVIGAISKPNQIIAICGHNKELTARLEALKKEKGLDLKVLGFVDNVYEYMTVADILISKSGGITVSESLVKDLPMVIISPIIGQETRNSDFLVSHNAAIKIDKLSDLKTVIEDITIHPEKIEKMKEAIRALKKPNACYDIANLAVRMANDE